MSPSAGCSRTIALILITPVLAGIARGEVLLTQQEALDLAFPEAVVERQTAYLDEEQLEEARRHAGPATPIASGLVPYYSATKDGEQLGVAFFDTHLVRTEKETVMVVVASDGRIARIEVITFEEPPDYLPRQAWLEQFQEHGLDDELALKRDIRAMTGATLTAGSITAAARRVLALYAVIFPAAPDTPGPDIEEPRP